MEILAPITIRIAVLDHNIFVTEVIEEILKNYNYELIKIKSLRDFKEPCDFLIIHYESYNDDLVHEIALLPSSIKTKIFITNSKGTVPRDLIPFLDNIVHLDEIDKRFKEIFDFFIFLHKEKTYGEKVDLVNSLLKESKQYLKVIIESTENILNTLSDVEKRKLLEDFKALVEIFQDEFIGFQNFNFVDKLPLEDVDINRLISLAIEEFKLTSNFKNIKFDADQSIDFIRSNFMVLQKIIKNLLLIISTNAVSIEELLITTKLSNDSIRIEFEASCENFNDFLRIQIFNPFYPRRILENALIDYFRNKIEKFLNIRIHNYSYKNRVDITMFILLE